MKRKKQKQSPWEKDNTKTSFFKVLRNIFKIKKKWK